MGSNLVTANYDKNGNQVFDPAQNPTAGNLAKVKIDLSSTIGAQKWFGGNVGGSLGGWASGEPTADASGFASTHGYLFVAEAPFYAVQLVIVNPVANAISGTKAIVGITETADTSVTANLAKPVIGGTTYGQLAPAGSINGFRAVTWVGAATASIDASVAYDEATGGSLKFAVSDVIPLSSIPRVDDVGGLPALVARVYHDGGTGGKWGFQSAPVGMRTKTPANRGRILQTMWAGSDAVTTPATNTSIATDAKLVFPIFHYAVPSLTVLVAGDSTEQNEAIVTDKYTSWGWRGCADASSPSRPVNYINCGHSSKTATEYIARTKDLINAGIIPDVLVISPGSVNGWSYPTYPNYTSNTDYVFEQYRAAAIDLLKFARVKGVKKVCWIPLLPYNSTNAASDAARKAFNAWLATIPGTDVLSFPTLGNGANPERWNANYNQSADGVHPNEFAIDTIMAPALTAYLNSLA